MWVEKILQKSLFSKKVLEELFLMTFLKEKEQMLHGLLPTNTIQKVSKEKNGEKMDAVAAESGQGGRAHGENEKRIK